MTANVVSRAWWRNLFMLLGGALACLSALVIAPPAPVGAILTSQLFTVTNCTDNPADSGSLRHAVNFLATGTAASTNLIVFGTDCPAGGPITLVAGNGPLTLAQGVTIDGTGHTVVVDGGCTGCDPGPSFSPSGGVHVFTVNGGVSASISNLTIQHGHDYGGGIYSSGTVTVTNSTFTGNSGGGGGGIYSFNGGILTVTNSTFTGNSASGGGGAGGGIANFDGNLTVTNSTFTRNSANGGGGIDSGGTATVTNSTLTGNNAVFAGGGIINSGGTLTLRNTIVAGNTAPDGPDIEGAVGTTSHNLIGDTSSVGSHITNGTNGDIVSATPLLGALGSNGGPTQTVPLLAGSPAIGAGDATAAGCASTGPTGVNGKDQRGLSRPAATCAIGSFEPQQATYTVGSVADTGAMATFAACQDALNTTCKLRDALTYAASGGDTVQFNTTGRGTIVLTNDGTHGTLTLRASVTVQGPTSGAGVTVDGGGAVRVFIVDGGVTATLNYLTIQHGNAAAFGGGVANNGNLTVANSTLIGNSADSGGAIDNGGGTVTVTNSTLTGNSAPSGQGGGIHNSGGTVTMTNSTLTGNNGVRGGGIENDGTLTLKNTIVAGNTANFGPDIYGAVTTTSHNLIGTTSGSSGITNGANGDIVNNTPLLGTFGGNGGTTQTVSLLPGSPALGHGDPTICANTSGTAPVSGKDQRGLARPAGACAIGAIEPQTYTVGSILDTGTAGTQAQCLSAGNTTCRLRDALGFAAGDTVQFNGTGRGTITLDAGNGTLTLTRNVTIAGPTSGAGVVVDGGCTFNGTVCTGGGVMVFVVNGGVTASISNLTIQHGNALFGAIENDGTLTVTNSTLTANTASGNGGGIYNPGTLTVTNSTFTANSASNGGGIYNPGMAAVTNSTLSGNSAQIGGGIYVNGGTLTVTNSTLTANSTSNGGGGIHNLGTATLTNAIVAGNTAAGSGPDLHGAIVSGGHNLIGATSASTGISNGSNGDIVNPNPLLGTLGSNGGTTPTIPLLADSPATGHGDPAICAGTSGAAPVGGKDQRGIFRGAVACSIGAFEAQPAVPNALPRAKPPGQAGNSPATLPGSRPAGSPQGPAPNPLPSARP